ncbi:T9SS C-terminal target domain-containing protein [Dysgonomonas sp. 216]|uniref:T9SS type A sorting domain-containing protein n=1 Tax=Dysgonomonas sp. 216 TaxID=2302934 RepID=UPI0013D745D1|nr:T9SS type A sorting domain-containing protein [Dysgonomonas sp. 216]NDW18446.1 T9SS C-terminal target domain-containing protein [Dysgonomonas sp. 216]
MKLRLLSLLLLVQLLFAFNVKADDGLVGNVIGAIDTETLKATVEMKANLSADNLIFNFGVRPFIAAEAFQIDWGDGTLLEYTTVPATDNELFHTYAAAGEVTVKIYTTARSLQTFSVEDMGVTSIEFSDKHENLSEVSSRNNPIVSLDMTPLGTVLTQLLCLSKAPVYSTDVTGSALTSVNLSANTELTSLTLSQNDLLTSIDISNNLKLTNLTLNGCTALNPSADFLEAHTQLRRLGIQDCGITALELSNHPVLESVYMAWTRYDIFGTQGPLQSLLILNSPLLTTIGCQNHSLKSLNLLGCPDLDVLSCQRNQLETIKLNSSVTSLSTLNCSYNKLDFSNIPQVNVTSSKNLGNQTVNVEVYENPAYTLNLSALMPTISGNNPGGVATPTYIVEWWAFDKNSSEEKQLSQLPSIPPFWDLTETTGNSTLFKTNFLSAFEKPYAIITCDAFPNVEVKTIPVALTGVPVGINEETAEKIRVYPNPFAGELKVEGAEGSMVSVVDVQGIEVFTKSVKSSDEVLSLDYLPSGMYLVKLVEDGKVYTAKVIKK